MLATEGLQESPSLLLKALRNLLVDSLEQMEDLPNYLLSPSLFVLVHLLADYLAMEANYYKKVLICAFA